MQGWEASTHSSALRTKASQARHIMAQSQIARAPSFNLPDPEAQTAIEAYMSAGVCVSVYKSSMLFGVA